MKLKVFMFAGFFFLCGCGDNTATVPAPKRPPILPPSKTEAAQSGEKRKFSGQPFEPAQKPTPPLSIKPPAELSKMLGKNDLSQIEPRKLLSAANSAAGDGDYAAAVQLQYWGCKNGGKGEYNLACYFARTRQIEPALYFLQIAAMNEGVDASWAQEDSDLTVLRADSRWRQVKAYLDACNMYWQQSGVVRTSLVLPKNYDKSQAIPLVIGLHGLGGDGGTFCSEDDYQEYADAMNVAFLSVSGTRPTGPTSFSWAENPTDDDAHLWKTIESFKSKVTVKTDQVMLFGFSQGAQMSFELALRYPEKYRGALSMSPGLKVPLPRNAVANAAHKNQTYVLTCGAGEHPKTIAMTRADDKQAKSFGAKCEAIFYKDMDTHTFPPDYEDKFGTWVSAILKLQK